MHQLIIYIFTIISFAACSQQPKIDEKLSNEDEKLIKSISQKVKHFIKEKKTDEAEKELHKIETKWPHYFYLSKGDFYFDTFNYDQAIIEYKKALEHDPNLVEAYFRLCKVYLLSGDKEKAHEECKKALKLEPDNVKYRFLLAWVLKERGNLKNSIEEFRKIIDLNPDYAPTYFYMGETYRQMDKFEESLKAYLEAIAKDKKYISAYQAAIVVSVYIGNKEQAVKLFKDFLELNPDSYKVEETLQEIIGGEDIDSSEKAQVHNSTVVK